MITDEDLQLLEEYLDQALSLEDADLVRRRLAREEALNEALRELQAARAARKAFYDSLEPAELEASQLAALTCRAARRAAVRQRIFSFSRIAGAAAACVALGFGGGWLSHTPRDAGPAISLGQPGRDASLALTPAEGGPFQVALTDPAGKVLAVQKFTRLEDASAFADDLGRWQAHRDEGDEGQPLLVSEHF